MAPVRKTPKNRTPGTRTQSNTQASRGDLRNETQIPTQPANTRATSEATTSRHRRLSQNPASSHTDTAPRFLQAFVDQWTRRQTLIDDYDMHKRTAKIDPIAQKAVSGVDISRFVQPVGCSSPATNSASGRQSRSLFHAGPPPEDLRYSLRNFVVTDPVGNANVIYTRIAIKEGRTVVGYVPALPQPRRVVENEDDCASEGAEDSEVFGDQ